MNRKTVAASVLLLIWSCAVPPPPETSPSASGVTLSELSLEQKVGQMLMVRYTGDFYRNDAFTFRNVKRLITERHLGGVIPYFGSVHGTIANLNELQSAARIPLLVAADYERGVGQPSLSPSSATRSLRGRRRTASSPARSTFPATVIQESIHTPHSRSLKQMRRRFEK